MSCPWHVSTATHESFHIFGFGHAGTSIPEVGRWNEHIRRDWLAFFKKRKRKKKMRTNGNGWYIPQGNGTRMGEYGDETSFMGGDYKRWHSLGAFETLIWGFIPASRVADPLIPLPSSTTTSSSLFRDSHVRTVIFVNLPTIDDSRLSASQRLVRNTAGGVNVTIASMDDTNATQDLPYVLRINALGNTSVIIDYNRPAGNSTQKESARAVWMMPDSVLDSADDR